MSILMVAACSEAGDDPWVEGEHDGRILGDETMEIVDNLVMAGYPPREIEVEEGGVVLVGGDAVVSLEASREMLGFGGQRGEEDTFRQYRTHNLVDASVETICIDGSAFEGTLGEGLDRAIANFNDLNLTFSMVRTDGSSVGCDAQIVGYVIDGIGGSAGFPSGGLPYDIINIGLEVADQGVAVAAHVITHELGHCLGFRHSDYFNRFISCFFPGVEPEEPVGAVHIPGTPTGAEMNGSLMNSCYSPETFSFDMGGVTQWVYESIGVFTASDFTAVNELYGDGPALRGIHVSGHASSDDYLYTIDINEARSGEFELQISNYYYLQENGGPGLVPLHRCLKPNGKHLYTQSPGCEGNTNEGVLGYMHTAAGTPETVALYRLYDGVLDRHVYTTSVMGAVFLIGAGYTYEGVTGYVWDPE